MGEETFNDVVKKLYLQLPDKNYIDDKLVTDISLLIREYINNNKNIHYVAISALDSIKSAELSFISMIMNQADMKGFVNFSDEK
jgi:hypothetical protein